MKYQDQVRLLLDVLPEISKENSFALYGGTAINLFLRDMPRLSVDIDLLYLPIEDRTITLNNIDKALQRIISQLNVVIASPNIAYNSIGKVIVHSGDINIKIEVNPVMRGILGSPQQVNLCSKAKNIYDVFVTANIVPFGQLYGSKICAALDRQHPRDLFDVKLLLENEGFTNEVQKGFLLYLLCRDRPINEILAPNFQNCRNVMKNHFEGMSDISFDYDEFEKIRYNLLQIIRKEMTEKDKQFIMSFKRCEPDWTLYNFQHFPAIQWKLTNLRQLKTTNPKKYRSLYQSLENALA